MKDKILDPYDVLNTLDLYTDKSKITLTDAWLDHIKDFDLYRNISIVFKNSDLLKEGIYSGLSIMMARNVPVIQIIDLEPKYSNEKSLFLDWFIVHLFASLMKPKYVYVDVEGLIYLDSLKDKCNVYRSTIENSIHSLLEPDTLFYRPLYKNSPEYVEYNKLRGFTYSIYTDKEFVSVEQYNNYYGCILNMECFK